MEKAKGYHRMSVLEGEYVASIHRMLGNIYGKTVKSWINKISENPREKEKLELVTCLTVEDQLQLQIRIMAIQVDALITVDRLSLLQK